MISELRRALIRIERHETKTFRGRPACAGSGTVPESVSSYGNALCPVCGRDDISTIATGKVGTHIHEGDLA